MIKNLIVASVSAVVAALTTLLLCNLHAKKTVAELTDKFRDEKSETFHYAHSHGWDNGVNYARLRYAPSSFLDDPIKD